MPIPFYQFLHMEYSLIDRLQRASSSRSESIIPCLNSSSSSTLNAANFCGSTPCSPSICTLALENPHCGVSGVPFMNNTTGAVATALSIAPRTCVDRKDFCRAANRGDRSGLRRGRSACCAVCRHLSVLARSLKGYQSTHTADKAVLENIVVCCGRNKMQHEKSLKFREWPSDDARID
jgi:hypothetical protein